MPAQQPWQQFSDKSSKDIKKEFKAPPAEYGMILWWGWDGPVNDTVIRRDLDRIKAQGFSGVMIEAGYGMTAKYLSPEWFELVRTGVQEAKKRGMTVWIEDEGKYPSGFAGGKFSQERPDLKMQGLVAIERIDLKGGESISKKLLPGTLSVAAVNTETNEVILQDISSGEINWTAPEGSWRIFAAGNKYRSSQTRSVNNPTRGKDTTASLMDYLNPVATRQFIDWTHEQYKKYIGDEFGKTMMGFMGDEPDFAYTPWTPAILSEFEKRKGYDVKPYLAAFLAPRLPEKYSRIRADYWDVWSELFMDNFFKIQADWCRENNIEYIVHLNHEDQLPGLVRSSGDFFKNMRYVAVPGVDAIWSQIWMDHVADYPKLASSAAHLYGKPRSFTESFAAYSYRPTVAQAKWVLDYQLVRGINSVQVMFMPASANRPRQALPSGTGTQASPVQRTSFFMSDTFPGVAAYMNRATYLLSQGRPACRTGLFIPTTSMWLSDTESNRSLLTAAQQLLEYQHDFDFIDEYALSESLQLKKGFFINESGQQYNTIIVPQVSIISRKALGRLREFASTGGKVVFTGKLPGLVSDKSILMAKAPEDLSWAINESSGAITPGLLNKLPQSDLSLGMQCKAIKYLHRKLNDGELYFIFNEENEDQDLMVSIEGQGKATEWNAETGEIKRIKPVSQADRKQTFNLQFNPWETRFIMINNR